MAFKIIQNTRINSEPFVFLDPSTVTYPVAPLVSAKFYSPNGVLTLKIRATLYVNYDDPDCPTIEEPTELESSLQLYFDYDISEEIPKSCNVWYLEVDYTSDSVGNVAKVVSFLKDIDPETSRGTSTGVDN